MSLVCYAHGKKGSPESEWQALADHLQNVAGMAGNFSKDFNAGEWGFLAGLWHDIGKSSQAFQDRLSAMEQPEAEALPGRPDHSSAGAQHAVQRLGIQKGKLLAYAIAGHHAGLLDGLANTESCLASRLKKKLPDWNACVMGQDCHTALGNPPLVFSKARMGFQIQFFIRMLYSCLVDADFLDTEMFMDPEKAAWRQGWPELGILYKRLMAGLRAKFGPARKTEVNRWRDQIFHECLRAASKPPGLFSLTVPTGGGKTLSSMAFALKHALRHGLHHIIYVIPFTSIVEQNADVFRRILGGESVLEHHCNFDPEGADQTWRLASENWNAPIVVTTNVQFFESFFGHRSSVCRKLHNVAKSVVILDEAQTLPQNLLRPCLEVIRELTDSYGSTVVLCTATQPALTACPSFPGGLEQAREIAPPSQRFAGILQRVRVENLGEITDDELSRRLREHDQVLCIVNTRGHARKVFEHIRQERGALHLSALMCGQHRSAVIKEIKKKLKNGEPCRVVSTSLVEAGVDLDFPVVFRALSGIDSIAQAAGRCNREGIMREPGRVFLFSPQGGYPLFLRSRTDATRMVLRGHADSLSVQAVNAYFQTLFWSLGEQLDAKGILKHMEQDLRGLNFPFREVSRRFKIIENSMETLVIPFDEKAGSLVSALRHATYPASFARRLQRFTVQVSKRDFFSLQSAGSLEILHGQYNILNNKSLYRDDVGLCPDDPFFHEADDLIF